MKSFVYVIQQNSSYDISPVMKYGITTFIFPHEGNLSVDASALMERALHRLENFSPDKDYVMLNGDPIAIAVVAGALLTKWPFFNALKYDRHSHSYNAHKIERKLTTCPLTK